MKKEEREIVLWGLAAIGLGLLLTKSKKDQDSQDSVGLGAIPNYYKKVGRINFTIAKQAHIKSGDIVINSNYLSHIKQKHGEQLAQLGIEVVDFIKIITRSFYQIRKGSGNSILLVVRSFGKDIVLALQPIDLIDDGMKNVWEIHSSYPVRKFNLKNTILWKK